MKGRARFAAAISSLAAIAVLAAMMLSPAPMQAEQKKKKSKPQPVDISKLTWPAPPEPARIRYIGSYTGDDIAPKKKAGWLERLAGVPDEESKSHLVKPYGVAVDSKSRAYVVDTIHKVVFVFDFENKTLEYRGDKAPAAFRTPIGAAIDEQDRLFVSDADLKTITCFDTEGNVEAVFGSEELVRPAGLAVDDALHRLYVADVKGRNVVVYDLKTLKVTKTIGKSVSDDADQLGTFVSPTNVAIDADGLIYVVDTFNNRVQVFDAEGDPIRYFGRLAEGAGGFPRPKGIAFDSDGHVYVVDAMKNQFEILTKEGVALVAIGAMGQNLGQFNVPAGIAIDRHNRIFVTDQRNRRLQVFQYIPEAEMQKAEAKPPAAGKSMRK